MAAGTFILLHPSLDRLAVEISDCDSIHLWWNCQTQFGLAGGRADANVVEGTNGLSADRTLLHRGVGGPRAELQWFGFRPRRRSHAVVGQNAEVGVPTGSTLSFDERTFVSDRHFSVADDCSHDDLSAHQLAAFRP